ncbi:MAG: hypothetical protein A2X48_19470 [Lentisphaerae bacterium GWF2_49_21]|nr:MAG: hypothetical protein A2X48_19470 [Lentisphaerae bacterium GWF2_49_21]
MKLNIFTYHDAIRGYLEKDLEFLRNNSYRTLDSDELFKAVRGDYFNKGASLTFDDGRISCWTVLYPLLKKYGCRAILFIVPGFVEKRRDVFQEKTNAGGSSRKLEDMNRYCSWVELKEMVDSGTVDVQSHSMAHEIVFSSGELVDFQRPSDSGNPLYPQWFSAENPRWGLPIYACSWKGAVDNEYRPDDITGGKCVEYVSAGGGLEFFNDRSWKKRLLSEYRRNSRSGKMIKIDFDRSRYLENSLRLSQGMIYEKLGRTPQFFAAPVHSYDDLVISILKKEGFKGLFNGGARTVVDHDGFVIFGRRRSGAPRRLSGAGRETLMQRILKRLSNDG